jgi:ribosomal protein L22
MSVKNVNGLDLDALHQTLANLKDAPKLARFEFRARNRSPVCNTVCRPVPVVVERAS